MKLVEKIQKLDCVEMLELLLEMWVSATQDTAPSSRKEPHKAPVSNIWVLMECFAMMAAVLEE